MKREKLEVSGQPPLGPSSASPVALECGLEARLRVIDEEESRKQPKICKPSRSQVLDKVERFLPEMQKEEQQLKQRLQKGEQDAVNIEVLEDPESDHIEMMVDCGLFDVLNPELVGELADSQKMKELKAELDAQLDAITDEDLLKLFQRSVDAGEESSNSEDKGEDGISEEIRSIEQKNDDTADIEFTQSSHQDGDVSSKSTDG